jgi:L,D-peptidoglycan transpeptidase YkuD (ErfK/YbiS/YcfS/YnhG family)
MVELVRTGVSRVGLIVRRPANAGPSGRWTAGAVLALGAVGMNATGWAIGSVPASLHAREAATSFRKLVTVSPMLVAAPPPPGIGTWLGARIPADTTQVVEVSGTAINSATSKVTLYQRTGGTWRADGSWPAHNGLRGWTTDHRLDDLRSPIGVFGLTDAGGLMRDPGSRMPYYHSGRFTIRGTGFDGKPLAGAFDYVIAINYNRVPGDSPLDPRRPSGRRYGGGIWLHVDHGGPTEGCVTVPREGMVALLRTLDPARHPVIVMGDQADLAR